MFQVPTCPDPFGPLLVRQLLSPDALRPSQLLRSLRSQFVSSEARQLPRGHWGGPGCPQRLLPEADGTKSRQLPPPGARGL